MIPVQVGLSGMKYKEMLQDISVWIQAQEKLWYRTSFIIGTIGIRHLSFYFISRNAINDDEMKYLSTIFRLATNITDDELVVIASSSAKQTSRTKVIVQVCYFSALYIAEILKKF